MNENYKKLMAQHGGYIPFTALSGTKTSSKTNSSKRHNSRTKAKKAKKTVRSKSTFMANAGKYAPGTIIRSNGILYHLDNSRQWLRV